MKNYSNCCKSLRCALHASCFCWFHACIDKTCHWIWVFIFSGTVSWLQWQPHKKIHKIIGRFYVWCSLTGRGNPQPRLWRSWPTRLTTLWWTEKTGNSTWAPSPGNVNFVSMKKLRSTNLSFWRNETDLSLSCVKGQGTHFKVGCGNRAGNCTATT